MVNTQKAEEKSKKNPLLSNTEGLISWLSDVYPEFQGKNPDQIIHEILDQKRVAESLTERMKELNCLYGISDLLTQPGISLDQIIHRTLQLLPPACQFPEIAEARIVLEGKTCSTTGFRETPWIMGSDIVVLGKTAGRIDVCYREKSGSLNSGPFLEEEWRLLNAIAERLGHIIERIRAEKALEESERKLRSIIDLFPVGVSVLDQNHRIVYENPALATIMHMSADRLMQGAYATRRYIRPDSTIMPPEEFASSRVISEKKAIHNVETGIVLEDETTIWVDVSAIPVGLPDWNIIIFTDDITERKKAEEIKNRFGRIFESSINEIYTFDTETFRFIDVNRGALENLGYTLEEIRQLTAVDIKPEFTRTSFQALTESLRNGELKKLEFFTVHQRKDGSQYPVEVHLLLSNSEIQPVFAAIALDITARRQAEDSIREGVQKLRLLTSLTRHDILNEITAIKLLHQMASETSSISQIHKYISQAQEVGDQIERTIGFTREYENFGLVPSGWLRIHVIIELAKKEVSMETISTVNRIPDDLELYADPILKKVFTTLLENAIRHGEKITTIVFDYSEQDDRSLIISCMDDGVGIPDSEKESIFQHGYGKHTGIGLYLAREILSITGMSILERGTFGEGSRFEILVQAGKFRRKPG
jgi:PAS domain S-box-containing protein